MLNRHFAGRRLVELDDAGIECPELRIHDTRLLAGVESLYTPRLRRVAGEIEPFDDEASESQQHDAMRRLHAAMRDSLTVARANRFVEQLLPSGRQAFARKTSRGLRGRPCGLDRLLAARVRERCARPRGGGPRARRSDAPEDHRN